MSRYWSKFCYLKGGSVTLNENFRGKGRPPPTIFGTREVESLGIVKKIAEKFNCLSMVHQRHRQTTDGSATAIANVNASSRPLKMIFIFTHIHVRFSAFFA